MLWLTQGHILYSYYEKYHLDGVKFNLKKCNSIIVKYYIICGQGWARY